MPGGLQRSWVSRAALARMLGAMLLCAPGLLAVAAEALPDYTFLIHVQPHEAPLCEALPVASCLEVAPAIAATGEIEFDLLLIARNEPPWDGAVLHLRWPFEWEYEFAELCTQDGFVDPVGSDLYLTIPTLAGAPGDPELLALGCVVLTAGAWGALELEVLEPMGPDATYEIASPARAGLGCGGCPRIHCAEHPAYPVFTPDSLTFVLEEGASDSRQFLVVAENDEPGSILVFSSSEDWLAVELDGAPGPGAYEVTVTVDAAALAPGSYLGWVRAATDECTDCAPVFLTVTAASTPARPESWGRVKRRFQPPR
jgi:hypothetical protein